MTHHFVEIHGCSVLDLAEAGVPGNPRLLSWIVGPAESRQVLRTGGFPFAPLGCVDISLGDLTTALPRRGDHRDHRVKDFSWSDCRKREARLPTLRPLWRSFYMKLQNSAAHQSSMLAMRIQSTTPGPQLAPPQTAGKPMTTLQSGDVFTPSSEPPSAKWGFLQPVKDLGVVGRLLGIGQLYRWKGQAIAEQKR